MSSDYDKTQWQAEQAARDYALEKQREKDRKTRERSARNAQRKLERLHRTLSEKGEITEFENEFGESVLERLDKFGSAFHDLEKGRPGDALSFAQKSVIAAMNKKVKALKKTSTSETEDNFDDGYERTADRWKSQQSTDKDTRKNKRSSFDSKAKPKFTPRVRHIEDDIIEDTPPEEQIENPKAAYERLAPELKDRVPYLPEYLSSDTASPEKPMRPITSKPKNTSSATKRPFLRLVK